MMDTVSLVSKVYQPEKYWKTSNVNYHLNGIHFKNTSYFIMKAAFGLRFSVLWQWCGMLPKSSAALIKSIYIEGI